MIGIIWQVTDRNGMFDRQREKLPAPVPIIFMLSRYLHGNYNGIDENQQINVNLLAALFSANVQ